jgi:Flp pilus assembly protein CpaB
VFPGFPINFENISNRPLAEDFDIPPGYRAISIAIDEVSSVSYKVRPNHRVDVLLSFTYQGQPAVIVLVETAKVLAVGLGDQKASGVGSKTATLLVSSENARKIELAKEYGKLSLVRAGESEIPKGTTDSSPMTLKGFFLPNDQPAAPVQKVDGKMFMTDPTTGRQTAYVLVNGVWKVESVH